MLKNQSRRQERECLAVDAFGFDCHYRDAEEVSDGGEESLLINLPRIEHLCRPRPAIEILRKLGRFLPRLHPTFEQQIDQRLTGR